MVILRATERIGIRAPVFWKINEGRERTLYEG